MVIGAMIQLLPPLLTRRVRRSCRGAAALFTGRDCLIAIGQPFLETALLTGKRDIGHEPTRRLLLFVYRAAGVDGQVAHGNQRVMVSLFRTKKAFR